MLFRSVAQTISRPYTCTIKINTVPPARDNGCPLIYRDEGRDQALRTSGNLPIGKVLHPARNKVLAGHINQINTMRYTRLQRRMPVLGC